MRIDCPYCGERDQGEFSYLGDATVVRPAAGGSAEAFFDYVYLRNNPAGPHREFWYHAFGCRAWLEVARDVGTHTIESVKAAASRADGVKG